MVRVTLHSQSVAFGWTLGCLLASLPGQELPKSTESKSFDVDEFFARSVVVDGTVNYYSTQTGSGIGQPDFNRDKRGLSVKAATGIDLGAINIRAERGLDSQLKLIESGGFKGAMLIRTAKDIDRALAEKKYGILFYVQKHYPLEGGVTALQRWYDKGLRVFQPQYNSRDGNQSPGERLGGGKDQKGGLTPLGRKVVAECFRLGIVVDLSHCNVQTTLETCAMARQRGVPVTANHTAARAVKDQDGKYIARYWRNATDREMLAIKATGGVVAVMGYGPYVRGPYQKLRLAPPPRSIPKATIDDYVAHLVHMVELIGPGHVGLSTDGYLDGSMAYNRTADGVLDSPRRWKAVIERMHAKGYSEADLQKIVGLNFLRVYRQVLKAKKTG